MLPYNAQPMTEKTPLSILQFKVKHKGSPPLQEVSGCQVSSDDFCLFSYHRKTFLRLISQFSSDSLSLSLPCKSFAFCRVKPRTRTRLFFVLDSTSDFPRNSGGFFQSLFLRISTRICRRLQADRNRTIFYSIRSRKFE